MKITAVGEVWKTAKEEEPTSKPMTIPIEYDSVCAYFNVYAGLVYLCSLKMKEDFYRHWTMTSRTQNCILLG